jgi:arsenate reductase
VSERPEVLFVCVHNAGRSQMAAGLLELRSNSRIGARSAGTEPADEIGPVVVAALREVGVDVSKSVPRLLSEDDVRMADLVVTMGCGDACPVVPGRRYEDWALDDPAGQDLETVRRIRDEIDVRVQVLVRELVGEMPDYPRGDEEVAGVDALDLG